jgi:hypothetical protein
VFVWVGVFLCVCGCFIYLFIHNMLHYRVMLHVLVYTLYIMIVFFMIWCGGFSFLFSLLQFAEIYKCYKL